MRTARKTAAKKVARKNPLVASIEKGQSYTLTDNGALTHNTTLNAVLDFFAMGGALRTRPDAEVEKLFSKAICEDPLLALKCLFHVRNCRGGAGERKTFRTILRYLGNNYPDFVKVNLSNIVHYGRFDDLFSLVGTKVEKEAFLFAQNQLQHDYVAMEAGEKVSLAAKWTPSANASSKEKRRLGRKFCAHLGVTEREFRKGLTALRKYSDVLEVRLSAGEWKGIDYSKLPSKAGLNYRKAFGRHDPAGYAAFLAKVEKGQAKINAGTLFPYELATKVLYQGEKSATIDAMWNALPDYLEGTNRNILVVADTSGSMNGLPLATSVSLALYTAERNNGQFKDYFITFSSQPTLQKVVGRNVTEKLQNLCRAKWDMSTDLQRVFTLILNHAINGGVEAADMPTQVIIVSDMEFNGACSGTNLDSIKAKYRAAGYPIPQLVFWNVNSTKNNVAAQANDKGVVLVSGSSPSVFKTLLGGKMFTPIDQMLETLNNPMYDLVRV